MLHLLSHISPALSISNDAARDALEQRFVQRLYKKTELLCKEGQVCRHLYFIEKGSVRGYYIIDGKDQTQWFGFEHDFVLSFRSYITKEASRESIEVLEDDAIIWSIAKDELDELLQQYPDLEKLVRLIYEHYYIKLDDRYSNAHFKTAAERYENLMKNSPHILQRMPLGYIASYLGISAETLSRIRNKM